MTTYYDFVNVIKSNLMMEFVMDAAEVSEYGCKIPSWLITADKESKMKNEFRNVWVMDIYSSTCILYKGANVDGKDVIPSLMLCYENIMSNRFIGVVRSAGIIAMMRTNPINGVCTIKMVTKNIIVEAPRIINGLHIIEPPRMLVVPVVHRAYVPIIPAPARVEVLVRSGATLGDLAKLRGFL